MTPKERAAMQQALEALEELHYSSGTVVAAKKYESATAALREALAGDNLSPTEQAELNLNCKSIQARLATSRWYVKSEQAEQKPVGMVIGGVFEPWNDDILSGAHELYAAPVRTKDLTDDEIDVIPFNVHQTNGDLIFARAAIAADREKNK